MTAVARAMGEAWADGCDRAGEDRGDGHGGAVDQPLWYAAGTNQPAPAKARVVAIARSTC